MAPRARKKKSITVPLPPPTSNNGKKNASPNYRPPSTASLLPTVFVAVIAFMSGVFTAPLFHALHSQEDDIYTSSPPLTEAPQSSFPLPPHYIPCTSSNLDSYLHATPVPGLHVVCIEAMVLNAEGHEQPLPLHASNTINDQQKRLDQISSLQLSFYKGSHAAPLRRRIKVKGGIDSISWESVKLHMMVELRLLPEGPTQQPWGVFTTLGEYIAGEKFVAGGSDGIGSNKHVVSSIAASGMVVVTQGGNWMWPGVREGFQRTVALAPPPSQHSNGATLKSHNVTIETLSLKPLVLSIDGFLTEEECDYIMEKAGPHMQYSSVSLKDADVGRASSDWRTSQSTFMPAHNDAILNEIDYRTASLTGLPRNHQEYVQVLRYGPSEKYDSHHDFFDPKAYASDQNTLKLIDYGKKNRFATVFWYLTDVEDGGHTIFPLAGGLPPVRDHADCSRGLKVKPQKGKVIIFYSLDASGVIDPLSLHGACPVGEGNVKWAANKWIWNAPMGFVQ